MVAKVCWPSGSRALAPRQGRATGDTMEREAVRLSANARVKLVIPWLVSLLICTEPVPAECMSDPDAMLTRPMCIAVSESCAYHQGWVYPDAALPPKAQRDACVARAAEIFAAELLKGYRRGRFPECFERSNEP